MIFLTVGTWRNGYDRLVKAVDTLVETGTIQEEVVAQVGYGTYRPAHLVAMEFCSPDEFQKLIAKSTVVVSHAGVGTIAQTVKHGKAIVVLPRKAALGEADSDHQFDTAKQLEIEGTILVAKEVDVLAEKLAEAVTFTPRQSATSGGILRTVEAFIAETASLGQSQIKHGRFSMRKLWPYRILQRDDDGIRADLQNVMEHFVQQEREFDLIVLIPNAGVYLAEMFQHLQEEHPPIRFVKVQRRSTVARLNCYKAFIFKHKVLSDIMRHMEVFIRLLKCRLGVKQQMEVDCNLDFDPREKRVLVIDDSVDTGTTLRIVKTTLLARGAHSVHTACISNHLMPKAIYVDYSVYWYRMLRTKNSRDYDAT